MARRRENRIPGSIYDNNGRWWWKVTLPGHDKRQSIPLRPVGAKYATADRAVAEAVARELWTAAVQAQRHDPREGWDGTIGGLRALYTAHAERYYRDRDGKPTRHADSVKAAIRHLALFDTLPAQDFGPRDLAAVRDAMVDAKTTGADGTKRRRYARTNINAMVRRIRSMFKWATGQGLIPGATYHGLLGISALQPGRSEARETDPVRPADPAVVLATAKAAPPTVAAMIELQLLTGMRSSELCSMRPKDIDRTGDVWSYRPPRHKTDWRGHVRIVHFGPRCQQIIEPRLRVTLPEAFLFTPKHAQEERWAAMREARQTPVQPSQVDRSTGERKWAPRFYADTYGQAVQHAIRRAVKAEFIPEGTHWHPHQLRHTHATEVRKRFGLDAARARLGQKSLEIASEYAELDAGIAAKIAREIG